MSGSTLAVPAARTRQLADVLPEALFFAGVFVVTAALAAANGGFFATSWGWSGLALFWAAAAALILRAPTRIGRLELVFLGLVTAFVGWVWLSTVWSIDVSASVLDGQRGLVLIGAVVAVLALAPARPVRPLLGAVLAATVLDSAYALSTRLFPGRVGSYDPLAVYRLNTPIGYWNGLGVFAALGAVLALGFAARGNRPVTRGLGGGEPARARADALLHLQPRRAARGPCGPDRAVRARLAPAPARRRLPLRRACARAGGGACVAVARAHASELGAPAGRTRRPPARARSRRPRGRCGCGRDRRATGRAAGGVRADGAARLRLGARGCDPRRRSGGYRALRQPADDRAQGLRLVHGQRQGKRRPQRAPLHPLEQRAHRALARRLARGERAPDPRLGGRELLPLLRPAPAAPRSRCRTRTASTSRRSPSSARPGSRSCSRRSRSPSSRPCACGGTRSSRSAARPTPSTSSTRASTGTGSSPA